MSYTKTTWSDGDVITAEKLNNIESGVESASSSGSILVVRVNDDVLDKTWQEIYNAITNMTPVYCYKEDEGDDYVIYTLEPISEVSIENDRYYVHSYGATYRATSSSSYPNRHEA